MDYPDEKKDRPEDARRIVLPAPGSLIYVPTLAFSMSTMRNLWNQHAALSGQFRPPSQSRLAAMLFTVRFQPGTVGSGAFGAVQALHAILGETGANGIGTFFGSPQAQRAMSARLGATPATMSNVRAAGMEAKFWVDRLQVAVTRARNGVMPGELGSLVGGLLGSTPTVRFRAQIQFFAGSARMNAHFAGSPYATLYCYGVLSTAGAILSVERMVRHARASNDEVSKIEEVD